jgi:hypothetical protein
MMRPCHKFVDFVEEGKEFLYDTALWQHPEYLSSHEMGPRSQLGWRWLCKNSSPFAIELLRENPSKICWNVLQLNQSASVPDMLERWMPRMPSHSGLSSKVDYDRGSISANPAPWAADLRRKYPARINFYSLSGNPAPDALALLEANPDRIVWSMLSRNPSDRAIALLRANSDKIHQNEASANANPAAMALLQRRQDYINWHYLSQNPALEAIELLRANPRKINWDWLSTNPGIFELDYVAMREQMAPLREELLRHVMHPKRWCK